MIHNSVARYVAIVVAQFIASFIVLSSLSAQSSLAVQIESALQSRSEASFLSLVTPESQQQEKQFFSDSISFPFENAIVKQAGQEENKLLLHVFFQGREEARFESWLVRTVSKENVALIRNCQVINALTGLYRLILKSGSVPVRDFQFRHFDTVFHLQNGNLFLIEAGGEVAGVIFLGSGEFEFDPPNKAEQQQVILFSKKARLKTEIQTLFVRGSPQYLKHLLGALLKQSPVANEGMDSRARSAVKDFDRNVYSVRLPFTEELWFTQLKENELYCEFKSGLGKMIYQHSPGEVDDVLLARKDKDQIISLYNSTGNRNVDTTESDFEVLSYKIRAYFNPVSSHISAVTEVKMKSHQETTTVPFRLNPELRVSQIQTSDDSLIYFQEKKNSNLHVVMNAMLNEGEEFQLTFFYQGKIPSEKSRVESMAIAAQVEDEAYLPPTFLYSNQSVWYPQLTTKPYASGEITVTVPENYVAVTNGIRDSAELSGGKNTVVYRCPFPAKYFSLFVGRLDGYFRKDSIVPIDVYYLSIDKKAAFTLSESADKILRFYSEYFGKYPYENLSLVLRPVHEPGGHAPATVAIVNRVFRFFQRKLGRDPLHIPEYPDFLLAHEIAHQWWGQTVGWQTYRDQWISEGFAQFAAWEYMRSEHGDAVWKDLAETFYEWIKQKTYAGPLVLGARLGHITEDPQAFSALLYNKGAYTLSMLKNWIGPQKFSQCLKDFFDQHRHQRVRIEEFQEFAQKYSDSDLAPFFQQWLFGWDIPDLRWSEKMNGKDSEVQIHFQQKNETFYPMKIPVEVKSKDGDVVRVMAFVQEPDQEITLKVPFVPASISVDPQQEILIKRH